jgi:soluble lytic murein transglycosylase
MSRLALLLLAPVLASAPAGRTAPAPRQAAGSAALQPAPRPFRAADIAPFFEGPLAGARADFEAGRFEAAARGFARSRRPQARFMRGVALVEAHRPSEAVKVFEKLERSLPEIADRVALWRGRAFDLVPDHRAAAASYGEVEDGSLLWPEARLARARALLAAGDGEGALEALGPVLAMPPPDETTRGDPAAEALLLAGQLHAAGKARDELQRARRAFIECWAAHPLSPLAVRCRAALGGLPSPHGAPPAPDESVRRAEALLDANRNDAALAELTKLEPALRPCGPGEQLACRARFALGKAYRKERRHTKAMEVLREVVDRCEDQQLRVRALYVLASAASVVAPEEGIRRYLALARDYPGHPFADDALFFAADLLARLGRAGEAKAALADLSERYPRGDYRPEAMFRLAWIEKQAGHVTAALAWLARVERDYEASDPYEHARAAYWRGRLLAERGGAGDAALAATLWRGLVDRYPADYYGLLARARLEEARPGSAPAWARPRGGGAEFSYDAGELAGDRHFRAGVLLLRMGLARPAAEELAAADPKALDGGGEPLLLLADLLDRAGDHKTSHNLVRTLGRAALRQRPEGAAARIWRIAYPPAYREEVERWAREAGVEPDLLMALMREESGLDPAVISSAGAVGLTQLMLPTARSVAKKLRMRRVDRADLMNPSVAIRIGASYLGSLLKRFGGCEALALAAYNAGGTSVRRWLSQRGKLPLDAFVEEIPVQETRGYVKRVLRSYAAYRLLYGERVERPVLIGQALPTATR